MVPGANPVIVVDVPEPVVVAPPGVVVTVHVPDDGKPFKTTLAVPTAQVGCVIVPSIGAVGAPGNELMVADEDVPEVQEPSFTVNVYVPGANPVIVVEVPVPVVVAPPGLVVIVQVPDDGKPLKATSPVDTEHVGCVIVPTTGAEGAEGGALIVAEVDELEVHPATVTVNV